MLRIRYTKLALADIAEAAAYIARDDPRSAERTINRVRTAIAGLALQPQIGRPGRVKGTRESELSPLALARGSSSRSLLLRAASRDQVTPPDRDLL